MNHEAPRVLFLAPVEPWGRENGSSLVIADLLEGLARSPGAQLFAVFMRRPPAGFEGTPPKGVDSVTLGVEGRARWASTLIAAARGTSPLRTRFANGRVMRMVARAVAERGFRPTIVHVEHLPLIDIGLKLARRYRCPLVYRAHNIESHLWERRLGARLPAPLARPVVRAMVRSEAQAMLASSLTLCISDTDLAWARGNAPAARSEVLPCTLLLERYDRVEGAYRLPGPQLCFVGGLEWAPNEAGLRWFVDEVLPRILEQVPAATLSVLARGAASRPWLTDRPGIRILPAEAEPRALFASCEASIAPLLQGGGVRIKIPESLAVGCPVVATTIGAEGSVLPHVTRADSPADFAAACIGHLARGAEAPSRLALRDAVERLHGADVHARRLVDLWQRLREGLPANEPATASTGAASRSASILIGPVPSLSEAPVKEA